MKKNVLGKSRLTRILSSAILTSATASHDLPPKLHRLEENMEAAAVALTPDDLREIESAASRITVHGARYPEQLERLTGR